MIELEVTELEVIGLEVIGLEVIGLEMIKLEMIGLEMIVNRICIPLITLRSLLLLKYASASAANFKIISAADICICFPLLISR